MYWLTRGDKVDRLLLGMLVLMTTLPCSCLFLSCACFLSFVVDVVVCFLSCNLPQSHPPIADSICSRYSRGHLIDQIG